MFRLNIVPHCALRSLCNKRYRFAFSKNSRHNILRRGTATASTTTTTVTTKPNSSPESFLYSLWKHRAWVPSNDMLLQEAEKGILQGIKTKYTQKMLKIKNGVHINTIIVHGSGGPPLVLFHGLGSGVGQWIANIDSLAQHYTIYACDLIGFGRSSRPELIGKTASEAKNYFVNHMGEWIHQLELNDMYLLGHSMGGYIAGNYAIQHPEKIKHLILVDSWGLQEMPREILENGSTSQRFLVNFVDYTRPTPLGILRAIGPYGPGFAQRVRPDLIQKFAKFVSTPNVFSDYIYHANMQKPTGEVAFAKMSRALAWAQIPLEKELGKLPKHIPLTFIFGESTWMDIRSSLSLKSNLPNKCEVFVLPKAGHHV